MLSTVGKKALVEAGIHSPKDLLPLPWDKTQAPPITDEERDELLAEMAAINALHKKNTEAT